MSGKSSLAKKMVEKYNADFLADDFVFIVNKKIYCKLYNKNVGNLR